MKIFYTALLSLFAIASLNAHEIEQTPCCPSLSTLAYEATSWCGRNDYLYLAHTNNVWYLKMKLQAQEDLEDINRYYLRNVTFVNDTKLSIYLTPLHEAVVRGHPEIVKILCASGAKQDSVIKSQIQQTEKASLGFWASPVYIGYICEEDRMEKEIISWKTKNHIGVSALQIAQKLITSDDNKKERRKIYNYLQKSTQ